VIDGSAVLPQSITCEGAAVVVVTVDPEPAPSEEECLIFTPTSLRATGAVALYLRVDGPRLVTARDVTGRRLWNSQ
jgi:competence protein ComEC